ncbi:serine/threonine protein kinase [Oscillatoria acuminata]|uniref:non-specific serine/threonine protein kinase n=1 Tax=Oscillatoria acuminata PCC 6304 TaxID=56110 RepID=K9TMS4_9CYAN|nr:serine/threonine-protein kinase [Oscillatoria acuminata]AFY83446.1 serine/threonine protein kinase [Oscillatoria acuminata PCC 6304]
MPILETLLADRYQIVKVLNADGVGNTYIAKDTKNPGHPKCFIKQLNLATPHPHCLKSAQHLFGIEAQTLKQLGNHDCIPQLLHCFTEADSSYLVQEWIEGVKLRHLLPIGKRCSKRWSESACLQFLKEGLSLLNFIHQNGFIHGNIAPDKLIKRANDGKFFLVDFASVQPIRDRNIPGYRQASIALPIATFGYLPPEQLTGNSRPNSDIYALGLLAIQALTGLHPADLEVNSHTGEIDWHSDTITPVGSALVALLNKMVRYHCKHRYQSAKEALNELQLLQFPQSQPIHLHPIEIQPIPTPETRKETQDTAAIPEAEVAIAAQIPVTLTSATTPNPLKQSDAMDRVSPISPISPISMAVSPISPDPIDPIDPSPEAMTVPNQPLEMESISSTEMDVTPDPVFAQDLLPPQPIPSKKQGRGVKGSNILLLGMWGGFAVNSLVITGGLTSLFYFSTADDGPKLLTQANIEYHAGNYDQAIALAESIPNFSEAYGEARTNLDRWRVDWEKAQSQFPLVEKAYQEQQWVEVIQGAAPIPEIAYWQDKIVPWVEEATAQVAPQTPEWLETAYAKGRERDFKGALELLKQIPPGTPAYEEAVSKIPEYEENYQIRLEAEAHQLLTQAYQAAIAKDFAKAIQLLEKIPSGTPTYSKVQEKIREYRQKQRIKGNSLLQEAYQRARKQDFPGAIEILKQVPRDTPAYAIAQTKQVEYAQKQRNRRPRASVNGVNVATDAQVPLLGMSVDCQLRDRQEVGFVGGLSSGLNPGDFLQEIS